MKKVRENKQWVASFEATLVASFLNDEIPRGLGSFGGGLCYGPRANRTLLPSLIVAIGRPQVANLTV